MLLAVRVGSSGSTTAIASRMGVDVALYKTLAFGVSAAITGIAGSLGAIAVQFVAPDSYTITLAISLFLGMVVGCVGWLPGSIVGSAFIIFVPNIAEGISKGLSGAVVHGWRHTDATILGVMDADGQHPAEAVPELVAAILGGSDLVIGSRYIQPDGGKGWHPFRGLHFPN